MGISSQTAVTPAGIRDGDPGALAALVDRRANAVLAYCEAVCSPADAERAAAEAFARFRAAVAAAEDPRSLEPGALLLGATRHAAASLTVTPTPSAAEGGLRRKLGAGRGAGASETCALIPDLLAARANGALSAADQERLARHLERHPACHALADAVDRAEAAYVSPPSRMVPIGALTEIMLALTAAAPIVGLPGAELEFEDVVVAEAGPGEAGPEPLHPHPPTESDPGSDPPVEQVLESHPPVEQVLEPHPPIEQEPPPAPELAEPLPTTTVFRAVEMDAEHTDANPTSVFAPGAAAANPAATNPAGVGGVVHPPPTRPRLHLPGPTRNHGVVYHYLLPGAVIAAALLGAMGVAGVFSTDARPPPVASPVAADDVPAAPPAGAPPSPPGQASKPRSAPP